MDLIDKLLQTFDLRAIAAMASNRVIGRGGKIPWQIPQEMAFFRNMTDGATVLMGRKTFESIGHPLPNRTNLVLTQDTNWHNDGVIVLNHPKDLLQQDIKGTIWLCGGRTIYEKLLPACREIFLSIVIGDYDGDAIFPDFEKDFVQDGIIFRKPEFKVIHFSNRKLGGK